MSPLPAQSLARELDAAAGPDRPGDGEPGGDGSPAGRAGRGRQPMRTGPCSRVRRAARPQDARSRTLAAQDDLKFEAAERRAGGIAQRVHAGDALADVGSATGHRRFRPRPADLLIATWLAVRHPVAREIAGAAHLAGNRPDAGAAARGRTATSRCARRSGWIACAWTACRPCCAIPVAVLKARYVNALATDDDAAAMADRLFPRSCSVLRALGVSCRYGFNPGDEPLLGDAAPLMRHALIIYADDPL